jgi:Flp pilus assembly protein TadG
MRRDRQFRLFQVSRSEQRLRSFASLRQKALGTCAAFARGESGAVAIIFGVALVPLAAMMGLALDYSRVSLGRAELQAAVDSAGLAAAQLPRDTPIATIQQKAQEWVESNIAGKNLGDVKVTAVKNGTNITFRAEGAVGMTLFSLLRKEAVPLAASNEVTWDLGKVEIALVLDNTGSMAGTKLSNLKTAAGTLVDTLRQAVTKTGQVRIGIVPFSSAVRLASSNTEKNAYKAESWLAQHALSPINSEIFWDTNKNEPYSPNRFNLFADVGTSWGGCVEGRPIPYDVQDTPPSTSDPETLFVPFFAPDEPDKSQLDKNYEYSNDYLDDESSSTNYKIRQGNYRKYDENPSSSGKGPNVGCSLLPILRLSTDLETTGVIKTRINQMTATGDTNIPLGLMWGWHLLSPHAPLADGVPYDTENVTKYIILMTDGDNTYGRITGGNENKSYYTSLGYVWQKRLGNTSSDPSTSDRNKLMNARLKALCANLRKEPAAGQPRTSAAPGIQVYAIGVGVNSTTKQLLTDCAYKPDMYYDVTNASDMTSVFTRIADEISQLRLSK